MSAVLDVDLFKQALPEKARKNVDAALVQKVNDVLSDPDMYEVYRENILSYAHVMNEGKFKLTSYIDAVKYVSQKLMNKTNKAAFFATFPAKIQDWTMRGVEEKDQASYITAYHKSKLVQILLEQAYIPSWIINQDAYQKAINTQVTLMTTANSEKVRSDAANSILTHLKPPETQKVELDIGVKEDSSIKQLRNATLELVAEQRRALQAGAMNAQEVAHSTVVIEGEVEDVE